MGTVACIAPTRCGCNLFLSETIRPPQLMIRLLISLTVVVFVAVVDVASESTRQRYVHGMTSCDETADGDTVRVHRCLGGNEKDGVKRMTLDPFLVFDAYRNDAVEQYRHGFPAHPHRGFLELRYITHGALRHNDSCGNVGLTQSGGLQVLFTGRGIVHEELPILASDEHNQAMEHSNEDSACGTSHSPTTTTCRSSSPAAPFRGFQVWINVPNSKRNDPPAYRTFAAEEFPIDSLGDGVVVKVLSGALPHNLRKGIEGPLSAEFPVKTGLLFAEVQMKANSNWFEVTVPDRQHVLLYVLFGNVVVGDDDEEAVHEEALAFLTPGSDVRAKCSGGRECGFLLLTAPRVQEKVFVSGGFVAGDEASLKQAFEDLHEGHSTNC